MLSFFFFHVISSLYKMQGFFHGISSLYKMQDICLKCLYLSYKVYVKPSKAWLCFASLMHLSFLPSAVILQFKFSVPHILCFESNMNLASIFF